MNHRAEKQAAPEAEIAAAVAEYPRLWRQMTSEWSRPENTDRAWLVYSANYLLNTGGVRWTLDPLTLHQRLQSAPEPDPSALAALDYIALTHRHADHLDLGLLRSMRDFPARWIVPEFLLDSLSTLNLAPEKLIIPHPSEPLHLGGLTLIPFKGLHWEIASDYPNGRRGVPAMGYLAEFNGKRWLFPGDTRTYDASQLPQFGPLTGLVAHMWLGRGQASALHPPLLDDFGRFCLALQPPRIILTHLNEWGRSASDLWTQVHARLAVDWFAAHPPGVSITTAVIGESVEL
jgi:L-ascorbate metabolism protein UlaG (beta-lactamase superfamily)